MELEDEESYAAAALFTLALHSSQHDRGNETELAWGCVWPEQQHGLPLMLLLLRVAVCPSATKATQAIAAAAMSGRSTCPSLSLSLCREPPDLEVDPSVLEHLDAAGLEAYWVGAPDDGCWNPSFCLPACRPDHPACLPWPACWPTGLPPSFVRVLFDPLGR